MAGCQSLASRHPEVWAQSQARSPETLEMSKETVKKLAIMIVTTIMIIMNSKSYVQTFPRVLRSSQVYVNYKNKSKQKIIKVNDELCFNSFQFISIHFFTFLYFLSKHIIFLQARKICSHLTFRTWKAMYENGLTRSTYCVILGLAMEKKKKKKKLDDGELCSVIVLPAARRVASH